MKKLFAAFCAVMIIFTACSQYAEPEVGALCEKLLDGQDVVEPAYATDAEVSAVFGLDLDAMDGYTVCYSGKGGFADMIAIFVLKDEDGVQSVADALEDYRKQRYEDFKGYAPIEAEKLENGRVLVYGRYVLLIVLPDISAALEAADEAFKA